MAKLMRRKVIAQTHCSVTHIFLVFTTAFLRRRLWVDIRGWNLTEMNTVAEIFGVDCSTVADMVLPQPGRFQVC